MARNDRRLVLVMAIVSILPFDKALKYPQRQNVLIDGIAYELYYRRNERDDFATLRITKTDGVIVSNWKITKQNAFEVKDPATLELLFTLFPYEVTEDIVEVWVFAN